MVTIGMCLAAALINTSGFEWNKHDEKIYKRAEYVCATDSRYAENRCVTTFTKTEERVYRVICGVQ